MMKRMAFPSSPFPSDDGEQGGAAGAEQAGKSGDDDDDVEGDAETCQGQVADIDPIHDVVQQMDGLSQSERNGLCHDQPFHGADGKILLFAVHGYISSPEYV